MISIKKLATIIIVITMILSVFGYAIMFVYRGIEQKRGRERINYVMEGALSEETKSFLLSRGITILEFYYNENVSPEVISQIENLPTIYTTPSGAIQLVVVKINSTTPKIKISSLNGEVEVGEMNLSKLEKELCSVLTVTPVECLNFSE